MNDLVDNLHLIYNMTCIACKRNIDWIEISCDTQTSYYDFWNKETSKTKHQTLVNSSKIYTENWIVIWACWSVIESNLMKIFSRNHKPKSPDDYWMMEYMIEFKQRVSEKDSSIVLSNEYIIIYENRIYKCCWIDISEVNEYCAAWSWIFFALSTLYLWFDTNKAVEVACEFDLYCWWDILTIKVPL